MKARPILFSGPMVQALLDGRKSQTRRVVKGSAMMDNNGFMPLEPDPSRCPYGVPGDLLWARETIGRRPASFLGIEATNGVEGAFYKADGEDAVNEHGFNFCPWWDGRSLSSIHMPRWASRLTLEITEVRAERLQAISEADAIAEGIDPINSQLVSYKAEIRDGETVSSREVRTCVPSYAKLWRSINGPESWDANPFVWAVSFKVHRANVDQVLAERSGIPY